MSTEEMPPALGQCTVTGKMVPEDELVTLHGQRVCAEGKAILLERLRAGETLPGELERPTILRRFGCIFVDGLILGFTVGLLPSLVAAAGGGGAALAGVSFITTTVQILYFGLLHGSRGQSVGKMAGKLVVVNMDGSPIDMKTAFIRALAYAGPGYVNALVILAATSARNVAILPIGTLVVGGWGIADVICALVDQSTQRSLHDRIAGTRVVMKQ